MDQDQSPKKDYKGKTRLELVPFDAVIDTAGAVEFGARKYAPRNWEIGMPWSVPFAAALRHLFKWWMGEDFDQESGLSHLAHASCNIMFLQTYRLRGARPGDDDRPFVGKAAAPTLVISGGCRHIWIDNPSSRKPWCATCGAFKQENL